MKLKFGGQPLWSGERMALPNGNELSRILAGEPYKLRIEISKSFLVL